MHTENEIKVLDIDLKKAEKKLLDLGFERTEEMAYRRHIYDVVPVNPNAWVRLRTDGKKTTLTFKESLKDSVDGMKEIEVTVDDFDETYEILRAIGHEPRSYQENSRTNFEGMNCTVSLDCWPLIPPYMEIEADTAEDVTKCLEALSELVTSDKTSLSTEKVYKRYGIDMSSIKELRFDNAAA